MSRYTPRDYLVRSDSEELVFHIPLGPRLASAAFCCFFGGMFMWVFWGTIPLPGIPGPASGYSSNPIQTTLLNILVCGGFTAFFFLMARSRELHPHLKDRTYEFRYGPALFGFALIGSFDDIDYLFVEPFTMNSSYRRYYRMVLKWKLKRMDYLLGMSKDRQEVDGLADKYADMLGVPYLGIIVPKWDR